MVNDEQRAAQDGLDLLQGRRLACRDEDIERAIPDVLKLFGADSRRAAAGAGHARRAAAPGAAVFHPRSGGPSRIGIDGDAAAERRELLEMIRIHRDEPMTRHFHAVRGCR